MQLMLTPTSPYARIVRVALMLKGLDDECAMHWVDPPSDTPELIQANPMSRVPVLLLDDGTSLTETQLIIHYLERRKPDPSLLPANRLYQELALAGKAMGLIDAAFWLAFNKRFGGASANEGNELAIRRSSAIERTLNELKLNPPHALIGQVGLGQLCLEVALEYIEFRLPEFEPFSSGDLARWSKSMRALEPFHLTEFY